MDARDEWAKYKACTRDYDSVLEYARAISASLVGHKPEDAFLGYAEQIFVKLIVHGLTLRALAPDPQRRRPDELWDLGSMSAVARCLIEACDALLYISDRQPSDEERDFRLQLWHLHDKTRRRKMLDAIGSVHVQADAIRTQAVSMSSALATHSYFNKCSKGLRKSVSDGDPPVYINSQRDRCNAAGLNYDYFNAATMQLSQYVHTLPFSVHQLFAFKAGDADALHLMKLPIEYALSFISCTALEMQALFPKLAPVPPSRVRTKMETWRGVAQRGVKNDG